MNQRWEDEIDELVRNRESIRSSSRDIEMAGYIAACHYVVVDESDTELLWEPAPRTLPLELGDKP